MDSLIAMMKVIDFHNGQGNLKSGKPGFPKYPLNLGLTGVNGSTRKSYKKENGVARSFLRLIASL